LKAIEDRHGIERTEILNVQDHDQATIGRRTLFTRGAVLAGGVAAATLIDTGVAQKPKRAAGLRLQ